jgi:hypothetical protein
VVERAAVVISPGGACGTSGKGVLAYQPHHAR